MIRRNNYKYMRRGYRELGKRFRPGDTEYDLLCKSLIDHDKQNVKVTRTMYWHWLKYKYDDPSLIFYATPPIGDAIGSDRILITGTKCETRDMYQILEGLDSYRRVMNKIQSMREGLHTENDDISQLTAEESNSKLIVAIEYPKQGVIQPKYTFSATLGSFWKNFFGEGDFLDQQGKVSVPRLIVGTGYMRNYNLYGGQTVDVTKRLEKIASAWRIPIHFIESWAPS